MLKEKALQVATSLEICNFKASNGWLESFRKRHNIQFATLNGESAEANLSAAEDWKKEGAN